MAKSNKKTATSLQTIMKDTPKKDEREKEKKDE